MLEIDDVQLGHKALILRSRGASTASRSINIKAAEGTNSKESGLATWFH